MRAVSAGPGAGPIRVVIADDHAVVRDGLRALVAAQPGLAVVGEAADGDEAWRRACELAPDVLLLDLSMPGVGGVEAAERDVTVLYAGHYATETLGVRALGAELERAFGLPWSFVGEPTGL